jgi:hypothetical protein
MAAYFEERVGQALQERNVLLRLPEEVCKHTLDDWKYAAAEYV